MRVTLPEIDVPDLDWGVIQARVGEHWVARDAPHISIMAQTRSGKSFLVTRGLMPLCRNDRVLFVDVKGNDPTTRTWGRPVTQIPGRYFRSFRQIIRGPEPEEHWYRLVVHRGPQNVLKARDQVRRVFDQILDEGDWIIVLDELRAVTDPSSPGLHLKPYYEEFILRGGSRGIATISCSQEPRWCPGAFYTQSNFYFFSKIEDEATHKRLAEVGSTKSMIPHIQSIPRRQFLYMDNMDDDGTRFWAKTKVKVGR